MYRISKKNKSLSRVLSARPARICGLLSLALGLLLTVPVWAEPRPVTLKSMVVSDFASFPPAEPKAVKPSFKEKAFPLKDAENHKEVQAFSGALDPAEKAYLEKNRFLLRAKPGFLPVGAGGEPPADEMLAWFDALGGSSLRSERKPVNARLVTPDVFLHAWHKYMDGRLAALERGALLKTARLMLAELFKNAAELRIEAGPGAADWERLMAQLAVPLILLDEAEAALEKAGPAGGEQSAALARFESYRANFSPAMSRSIRSELIRIHRAEALTGSLMGLSPAEGGELVDYRLFQPRGAYAVDAVGRGYHRALTWLSRLGWDARTESGLADALNWALAMSYERPPKPAAAWAGEGGEGVPPKPSAGPVSPRRAWLRFMEISVFFFGYPESPGYLEWLPFLMKESGVPEFTAVTSSEMEVLGRLALAADLLSAPARPYFKDWPGPKTARVLCIFPQPRAPSALIAAEPPGRAETLGGLPQVSSALWLPVLLGHREAREMLPRQVSLGRPRPSLAGEAPGTDLPQRSIDALTGRLDRWSARIKAEPEAAWFATAESARLKLLSALLAPVESGYPLYMRSAAFPTRRLESVLGAYTELRHEAMAPPPPAEEVGAAAQAPSGPLVDGRDPAPVVKGLIEPSDFWREMIRVAGYTRAGFRKHGLFPEDLEDFGALNRFIKRLERCAALADQELAGQKLNEDDYEFIRLFTLSWMAQPPGGGAGPPPEAQIRSGLAATLQELPPEIDGGLRVYEATAEPWLMLALVGNEKTPRLALGLAYSHYEFAGPYEPRVTDAVWQLAAYARYLPLSGQGGPTLPARNFWYEALKP